MQMSLHVGGNDNGTVSLLSDTRGDGTAAIKLDTLQCPVLGTMQRLDVSGGDDKELKLMAGQQPPSFAVVDEGSAGHVPDLSSSHPSAPAADLSGQLRGHGPAFVLRHVLTVRECQELRQTCDNTLGFGTFAAGKNHHDALQVLVGGRLAHRVAQRLEPFIAHSNIISQLIGLDHGRPALAAMPTGDENQLHYCGINRRWRIYRYQANGSDHFKPHIDAAFPPSGICVNGGGPSVVWDISNGRVVSRLTLLMYLNDDFAGGATNFYAPAQASAVDKCGDENFALDDGLVPKLLCSVPPRQGAALIFPQAVGEEAVEYARQAWPLHAGTPVTNGNSPKYVIRSDILFGPAPKDTAMR